ncbi:MAG TPA: hypothetical protein EYQ20_04135 [candidate division Zixibacteria bacterium]|nr:hypothetical protein [candidate division Zixibacteria bacterium]
MSKMTSSTISRVDSLQQEPRESVVTLRAVMIGLTLSILMCLWITYSTYIGRSSTMPVAHFPVAALLPFVCVVLGLNVLLKKIYQFRHLVRPLRPSELLVVFVMVFTASAIPGWAFTTYLVVVIGSPYYFATPENRWEAVFFDHLPDWLVASNQGGAMTWFFESLPAGDTIPWGAWIPPFVWWTSFFFALFTVGACLMIVLRRQWSDHEKLTFPLAKVPVLLTQEEAHGGILPPVVRNRVFLAGFGITLFIIVWNIGSYFHWIFPIPIGKQFTTPVTIAHGFPPILIRINWLVLGFAYFANLDVLFSIWLFRLIAIIQEGLLSQIGFSTSNPKAGLSSVTAAQNIGGFFFFVLWGLWMARRHLRLVVRKAFGRAPEVDDRDELLSYRTALIGFVVGIVYIICWLTRAGMGLWVAVLLMACVLLLYLGVTRIVSEAGVVLLDFPLIAHDFTISVVGSSNLSSSSLTVMGMTNPFVRNWRTFGMTTMAHVAKIGDDILGEKRRLIGVALISLLASVVTSVGYTIYLGYTTIGADHFGGWGFTVGKRFMFDEVVRWISVPTALGVADLGFMGFGAVVMWGLIQLRYQFPGWPLHPVGFAIASSFATDHAAFSIFVAWFIKSIVLRAGGVSMYKKSQSFFLGILVAFSVGVALTFAVDSIWFPGQGHEIDNW